jgi:hypothetical protein
LTYCLEALPGFAFPFRNARSSAESFDRAAFEFHCSFLQTLQIGRRKLTKVQFSATGEGVVVARKPTEVRRKLVEFDAETWHGLNLLTRESMKSFQELADEAFRDLLRKYGRPTELKTALREITRSSTTSHAARRHRGRRR